MCYLLGCYTFMHRVGLTMHTLGTHILNMILGMNTLLAMSTLEDILCRVIKLLLSWRIFFLLLLILLSFKFGGTSDFNSSPTIFLFNMHGLLSCFIKGIHFE